MLSWVIIGACLILAGCASGYNDGISDDSDGDQDSLDNDSIINNCDGVSVENWSEFSNCKYGFEIPSPFEDMYLNVSIKDLFDRNGMIISNNGNWKGSFKFRNISIGPPSSNDQDGVFFTAMLEPYIACGDTMSSDLRCTNNSMINGNLLVCDEPRDVITTNLFSEICEMSLTAMASGTYVRNDEGFADIELNLTSVDQNFEPSYRNVDGIFILDENDEPIEKTAIPIYKLHDDGGKICFDLDVINASYDEVPLVCDEGWPSLCEVNEWFLSPSAPWKNLEFTQKEDSRWEMSLCENINSLENTDSLDGRCVRSDKTYSDGYFEQSFPLASSIKLTIENNPDIEACI